MSIYGSNQTDWSQPSGPAKPELTAEEQRKQWESVCKQGMMLGCLVTLIFGVLLPIILLIGVGLWAVISA